MTQTSSRFRTQLATDMKQGGETLKRRTNSFRNNYYCQVMAGLQSEAFCSDLTRHTLFTFFQNMLFGTYTDRGTKTCAGRPAALGHEQIDANTYAAWGVRRAPSGNEKHSQRRSAQSAGSLPCAF